MQRSIYYKETHGVHSVAYLHKKDEKSKKLTLQLQNSIMMKRDVMEL